MNKLLYFTFTFLFGIFYSHAQIGIGKSSVDGDGLLDFPLNSTNGIILPIVTNLPTGIAATNGTILMDYNDGKVKMKSNNQWVELTKGSGNLTNVVLNTSPDLGQGVILGDTSSSAEGVLILESKQKALILPKVDRPHLNVISPYPGMICYDTYNKCISVYNGTDWFFWK